MTPHFAFVVLHQIVLYLYLCRIYTPPLYILPIYICGATDSIWTECVRGGADVQRGVLLCTGLLLAMVWHHTRANRFTPMGWVNRACYPHYAFIPNSY